MRSIRWGKTGLAAAVCVMAACFSAPATAQTIRSWTAASNGWLTTTNWNPSGTWPGSAPNANPTGEGTATDIFSIAPTNTASTIGINMNTLVAGGGVGLILGGMDINKTETTGVTLFDSSSTVAGLVQLNGATINSVANTLIRVTGSANLTLAGISTGTLGLRLGNTNGIFDVGSGRNLTLSGTVSEPAATPSGFTKTSSGTLTLNAANTFSGTVTLSAGVLALNNSSALGTGTLSLGASAAQVAINSANIDINRPVTVAGGGGGSSGQGLIQFAPSTGSGTWSGNITINGSPASGGMFGSGGGELVLSGTVRRTGSSVSIRSGIVTLANAGNAFNDVSVTSGVLKLGVDNAVPVSGSIGLTNSANLTFSSTLSLNGFNQTAPIVYGSGSSAAILNDGGARKTLTLTGATLNSVANTVISKSGTGTMTFSDGIGGLDVVLSTGTNVPVIDATTGVTISSTLTSANGLTKIGAGSLVLSANNDSTLPGTVTGSAGTIVARTPGSLGSGTVTLAGSTLQFDTAGGTYSVPITTTTTAQINASNVAVTLSGPITISGSTVFRGQGGSSNQFTLSNANAITSTNDSSVTFNVDSSQNHQVSGIVSLGAGGVTKLSTATLTLANAANSYSGGLIQAGSGGITISANRAQGSGPITFAAGGSGAITFSNVSGTIANAIVANAGSGGITKTGTAITTFTGTNTYSGNTVAGGGTLAFGSDQSLAGSLVIGSSAGSTTTGSVDLTAASGTFGGLTVQTNSSNANVVTVGSGRTLGISGNVSIGANSGTNVVTSLTMSGGGTWTVTNAAAGAAFQVGAATGGTNYNPTIADLSGLGVFSATLSNASSMFRVGDIGTASTAINSSTMTLAPTSTITSATVAVGDSCGSASTQSLLLGSGVQTINANVLAVGLNTTAVNSRRSSGLIQFASGSGSLLVRGLDGTSQASLAMNKSSSSTTSVPVATLDVTGHDADLLLGTTDLTVISVDAAAAAIGAYASTLSFDRGTLTSGTTNIGARLPGQAASGGFSAVANIGSASNFTNTANLGAVTLAAHSGSNCTIRGALNVTGTATTVSMASLSIASNTAGVGGGTSSGTVAISGGATTVAGGVTLASSAGFGTVTGVLNVTGGSLTVGGNITQAGTVTGSLAVNGGSLDMAGFAIGSLANPISSASFLSGTIGNLGEFNGGAAVTKTVAGTLVFAGNGGFTGGVQVNAGTVVANAISALGSGTLSVNGGTLNLNGLAVANALTVTQGAVTNASNYAGTQTVSGAITYAGTVGGAVNVAAGGLLKGSSVTFTGPVSITGTHSPGSSPGLQTFTSGLGYTSAATLVWELSANTAAAIDRGILYDAIDLTNSGTLAIDSAATLSLVFNAALPDTTPSTVDWSDPFWADAHQWLLVDVISPVNWNEVTFGNVLIGNDVTGTALATARPSSSFTVAAQGGDLYVVYVPEPSLALVGLAVLAGMLHAATRRGR